MGIMVQDLYHQPYFEALGPEPLLSTRFWLTEPWAHNQATQMFVFWSPAPKPWTLKTLSPIKAQTDTCSIKIAQKPSIIGSLGPKALNYESFDGKG